MSKPIHYDNETQRFYILNEKGEKEYVDMRADDDTN